MQRRTLGNQVEAFDQQFLAIQNQPTSVCNHRLEARRGFGEAQPATARYAVIRPLRASRFYSLSFNTRDFRTIHGSLPACGSSSLTSSLRNKKAPGLGRGLAHTAGLSLPADLEAGSATRAAANGAASTVTVGDHLDPKCILVLEVRGLAGLAQRIQAVLRRTRGCGGESRQLEDHP